MINDIKKALDDLHDAEEIFLISRENPRLFDPEQSAIELKKCALELLRLLDEEASNETTSGK